MIERHLGSPSLQVVFSVESHGCFSICAADFLSPGSTASMPFKKSTKIGTSACGMSFGFRRISSLPSISERRDAGESFGMRSRFPDEKGQRVRTKHLEHKWISFLLPPMSSKIADSLEYETPPPQTPTSSPHSSTPPQSNPSAPPPPRTTPSSPSSATGPTPPTSPRRNPHNPPPSTTHRNSNSANSPSSPLHASPRT